MIHCVQDYSGMSLGISVFDRSYELSRSLCEHNVLTFTAIFRTNLECPF